MKRSCEKILSEILEVSLDGTSITGIIYQANLNFEMASRHLETLVDHDLIEMSNGKYKTTKRGKEFLNSYQDIQNLI